MDRYSHVTNFCLDHPWGLTQPYREVIAGVLARRIAGRDVDPAVLHAAQTKRESLPQPRRGGGVAIIPVHGVIMPRADLLFEASGLVSLESLIGQIRDAVADSAVRTIVLDVDSPGGNVAGCTEFVADLITLRQQKPVIAVAHYTMASAAYWISAAATEIVASPSAMVGSIGVYTLHEDISAALEMLGIKLTYIFAGKHKVDGNETQPLDKSAKASIQKMVDDAYGAFVGDIAKGRTVPIGDVRGGYGEGRTVRADEALALGMIDRVATLDETIARLTPSSISIAAASTVPDLVAHHSFCNDVDRALFELELTA